MYLYRASSSFFHLLHPVMKLVLLLLLIVLPFLGNTLPLTAILFFSYLALLIAADGSSNLRKFWKMLLIFWVFTFGIWMLIPRMRGWEVNYENAALLATRIDAFVLSGLFFVTITRIEEFTYSLTRIGIPYKVAFTLSLGFRLVPLFYQNLHTIVDAQKSRGVDLESGGFSGKARKFGPIVAVLISYSLRNADLMAMSLEAKGFGYSANRTSYLQPSFGWRDLVVLFVSGIVVFLLVR